MKLRISWKRHISPVIEVVELIATVVILWLIVVEVKAGNKQAAALTILNDRIAAQGKILTDQARALQALTKTEKDLLSSMETADSEFRSSLAVTRETNRTMRAQLAIVHAEQQARIKEESRVPRVVARIGGSPFPGIPGVPFKVRHKTPTATTFDLALTNAGKASLRYGTLTMDIEAPDVTATCSCKTGIIPIPMPPEVSAKWRSYEIPLFRRMAVGVSVLITLTVHYPAKRAPFDVTFQVDGDNYPVTTLGAIIIHSH